MKKSLITTLLTAALATHAFAQGTIIFDSSNGSGWVTEGAPPTIFYPAAGSWTAALLFAPGTTLGQPINNFIQVATVSGSNANAGYISGGTIVTIPQNDGEAAGAPGTFIVEGWEGHAANYAAALNDLSVNYFGATAEFVNGMGNPTTSPPGTPSAMTGWDGTLDMWVPEPSSIAVGVMGAAAMVLLRRRNRGGAKPF